MMERLTSATPPSADDATRAIEQGFVARESWAYDAAYRLYGALLVGAAVAVLRDRLEAEDCVHDVLARLWQRGHAYTAERGALRAFLCVCVRNEALSRMRRDANRRRIHDTHLSLGFEAVSQPEGGVDDRLAVTHALDALSRLQREAIDLAYYQGYTHEQIAQHLEKPVGTIKSRISDALRALRAALGEGER